MSTMSNAQNEATEALKRAAPRNTQIVSLQILFGASRRAQRNRATFAATQSYNFSSPCRQLVFGLHPSSRLALLVSAMKQRWSPGRQGSLVYGTGLPRRSPR